MLVGAWPFKCKFLRKWLQDAIIKRTKKGVVMLDCGGDTGLLSTKYVLVHHNYGYLTQRYLMCDSLGLAKTNKGALRCF